MTRIRWMSGGVAMLTVFAVADAALSRTRLRVGIAACDGKTAPIATREGAPVKVSLADNCAAVPVAPHDSVPRGGIGRRA